MPYVGCLWWVAPALAGVYDDLDTAFAASPAALRAAADAVALKPWFLPPLPGKTEAKKEPKKKDKDEEKPATVEVLHSVVVRFDDAGLATTTRHDIWRIERDDTSLRTGTMYWDPWRESRPSVDLRVIAPDGKERRLDPSTLVEQSAATGGGEMYVDTRKLIAPLPGARRGAIVEQVDAVAQTRHYLGSGENGFLPVSLGRTGRVEIVLDAPQGLPLRFDSKNLGTPKESKQGGRHVVRWIVDDPELVRWPPDYAPRDTYNLRYVSWSSAPDWGSVAHAYSTIVDEHAVLPPEAEAAAKAIRASEPDDRRAATAMARWFNDRARYVAVELGAAAVTPRTPSDVLSRGFGDCKDKATFLVAMLRSVGISAHVALLRAGWDPDVDPKLPGPNLFNHAITVLDGGKSLIWVDPTQPELPAGRLPGSDTDHWALIAAPGTTALVRTPPSPPTRADVETRIVATDFGGTHVVQTTTIDPVAGASTRERAREAGIDTLTSDAVEAEGKQWRAAKSTVVFDADLDDLDKNVVETSTFEGARSLVVAGGEFTVHTGPGFAGDALPRRWSLGLGDDDAPRTVPVVLTPYDQNSTYILTPPRGYTLVEPPAPVDIALGTGRFTWTWTPAADGTLRSQAHLVVPATVSVAELDAFGKALKSISEKFDATVRFLPEGTRFDEDGKVSEALAAFARATSAPNALVADRVAYASELYRAGYAGKALSVLAALPETPDTESQFFVLGWDAAVRQPQGFARARGFATAPLLERLKVAIAKAEEEEHESLDWYRDLYAGLLEYDGSGVYGRGDLTASLEAYKVADRGSSRDRRINLLLRLGDGAALKELTQWNSDDTHRAYRLAALALADGLDAAVAEAKSMASDAEGQRRLYNAAAVTLGTARQYDTARLFVPLLGDTDTAKELVPSLVRHETVDLAADTPTAAVQRFLRDINDPAFAGELKSTIASAADDERYDTWGGPGSVNTDWRVDQLVSPRKVEVDGDAAGGFRLRWEPAWGTNTLRYFVVREKGAYKLRVNGILFDELGEEAGARLDAGKLADAQRWLDWALFDTERPAPPVWAALWSKDGDRSADRVRLMVALLTAPDVEGDRHLKELRAAWTAKTADAAVAPALAMLLERQASWTELLALGEEMRVRQLDPLTSASLRVQALAKLGRVPEAEAEARSALAAGADTVDHWSFLITALTDGGAYDASVRLGREGILRFPHDQGLVNTATWPMMFLPALPEEAGKNADRILEGPWSAGRAQTSACIYAAMGRIEDARKLVATYAADHDGDVEDDWAYVWGRIAEADGMPDEARTAYLRVLPAPNDPASTWTLTQMRLAALPAPKKHTP